MFGSDKILESLCKVHNEISCLQPLGCIGGCVDGSLAHSANVLLHALTNGLLILTNGLLILANVLLAHFANVLLAHSCECVDLLAHPTGLYALEKYLLNNLSIARAIE